MVVVPPVTRWWALASPRATYQRWEDTVVILSLPCNGMYICKHTQIGWIEWIGLKALSNQYSYGVYWNLVWNFGRIYGWKYSVRGLCTFCVTFFSFFMVTWSPNEPSEGWEKNSLLTSTLRTGTTWLCLYYSLAQFNTSKNLHFF